MIRRNMRVLTALLLVAGFSGVSKANVTAESCDSACLSGLITRYLNAMVAHKPDSVPVTDNVRFTQNLKEIQLGDSLWKTITGLDKYRVDILDVSYGGAFTFVVVKEGNKKTLLSLRLKIVNKKISQIETMVTGGVSDASITKNLTTPNPKMTLVPEASLRNTRKELIDIAELYPKGLRRGGSEGGAQSGAGFDSVGVPFVPNYCYRVENGMNTAGVGSSSPDMLHQKFPYMPNVFDKLAIVDEHLGIVVIRMNFRTNSISSANTQYLEVFEAFKIYNDSMRAVEAFMRVLPADKQATTALQLFGWPYDEDITAEISTSINPSTAGTVRDPGKVIAANSGVSIPAQFYSDKIVLDVYEVSGRLVHTRTVVNTQKRNAIVVPMNMLSAGHYIGRVRYYAGSKVANSLFFNMNSMR